MGLNTILKNIGKKVALDYVHPIGQIFISADANFDPNVEWGGTWTKLTDKFLIGAGSTYVLGAEGGSTSYTPAGTNTGTAISVNQMPAHSHTNIYYNTGASNGVQDWGYNFTNGTKRGYRSSANEGSGGIGNTGGGQTHTHTFNGTAATIIPPYKAVYFWQRTA